MSSAPRSRLWLWAGVESLLGFVLVMIRIDARSVWFDEGFSANVSGASWGEITQVARNRDPNMTGYHAVLHLWQDLFGNSETALRSLSAVSAAGSVLVLVALTRRLRDARTALVAGLLLAVAPLLVRYGQEVRAYALEVLLVTIATYCFVRLVDPDDPAATRVWPVVAYGAAAAFACYAHLFAIFVIAAHAVSLLFLPPAALRGRRLAASAGVLAVLLVPLAAWFSTGSSDQIGWILRPGLDDLFHVSSELAGGDVITLLLGVLVIVAAVHAVRANASGRRSRALWVDGLGLTWLVLPFAVAFVFSLTVQPIFLGRYLIICVPAIALVAATGLMSIRSHALAVGTLVLLVGASVVGVVRDYGGSIQDWRAAVAVVAADASPQDGLVVCPAQDRAPIEYYVRRTIPADRRPIPLSPSEDWGAGLHIDGVPADAAARWDGDGPERIWVFGNPASCNFALDGRERADVTQVNDVKVARYDRAG